jgi:hypothetical protein
MNKTLKQENNFKVVTLAAWLASENYRLYELSSDGGQICTTSHLQFHKFVHHPRLIAMQMILNEN